MKKTIRFKLNGKPVNVEVVGDESLLTVIRTNLNQTGTKFGCGLGQCGTCTVLVDNEPFQSCTTYIEDMEGKEITTIEGMVTNEVLHPIQKAFVEHDALQCGFCTPGMIMNAFGLLLKNPEPSRDQIIKGMEQNLCRCGSYNRIVDAIQTAGIEMNKKI
ncbi:(2Fe-2S)-binding protein [Lutibacter sp.]|uniref:(2Fe-2S)-binding protein n=1 Tax=Lutibacter sp. TaxID=1925666 RepID=UPI002736E5A3|nr:(2Fe-2S)-binding protein [Lutibacter sp.]MDP3313887.1 (2Fe-2S)-binding protein [Lutibacter sp.]